METCRTCNPYLFIPSHPYYARNKTYHSGSTILAGGSFLWTFRAHRRQCNICQHARKIKIKNSSRRSFSTLNRSTIHTESHFNPSNLAYCLVLSLLFSISSHEKAHLDYRPRLLRSFIHLRQTIKCLVMHSNLR